jgi:hypothetical protein
MLVRHVEHNGAHTSIAHALRALAHAPITLFSRR